MMQQALNAVIYARYSSHNQTEQSIEGQLRDCYAFAEREGLQVVGEYIDRAITGRTDERPDFQRMIADARKQEFQRVIVWKFDRFSRDRYDSAIYKHKLKQCGVRVLSAMENVGEGDVSIILEALLEASAEQYSLDLSKKVLRGQRESRLKGTFLGGLTPIGYKLENRKLVADERTAPIVRYIFEQYAKGTSKQDIINELATRGILNRHGKPLSHSTLQTILKNKKYIGVYTHGGQDVAGGCEALIDEKTFLKVQEQLSKRKHAPAASKAVIEYLLQGKLYCGYCGFNMFGDSGRGRNGSTYRYYACRRRKKERDCKKKNEKKDFIEWYVVEQTVEYILTPERIEYIASELVAQYKKDCGIDRIKAYEKQLDRIKAEISRLVDTLAVCPAAARQPIFDKMEQLDAEKQEAELDLSKLRISAKIQISKEHIADWLKQFCNGDALDVDFQKRIIDTFINSVYLYDDKVIIYYNIEGGKQVSYIDMIDSTEEPPFSDDAPGSSGGSDLKRPALPDRFPPAEKPAPSVHPLRCSLLPDKHCLPLLPLPLPLQHPAVPDSTAPVLLHPPVLPHLLHPLPSLRHPLHLSCFPPFLHPLRHPLHFLPVLLLPDSRNPPSHQQNFLPRRQLPLPSLLHPLQYPASLHTAASYPQPHHFYHLSPLHPPEYRKHFQQPLHNLLPLHRSGYLFPFLQFHCNPL